MKDKLIKVQYKGSVPMYILCKSSKGWMTIKKGDELELTQKEIVEFANLKLIKVKNIKGRK